MRVLMVCPQFRPIIGGYERAAERLAGELVRQGCSVTIVTERREKSWAAYESLCGFTIRRLWCVHLPNLHIVTSLISHALFLICNGRTFDVWHVHQYGVHATLSIFLGKVLRRAVVLKLTSSGDQGLARVIETGRVPALQALAHRMVDACVAVSIETANEALRFGIPAERIETICNGVDIETFAPATHVQRQTNRELLGLSPRPAAIFVGRLSAEKNPLGLLEAWRLAWPRLSEPWTLVFVGDGPLHGLLKSKIREYGLTECIVLAGQSPSIEKWLQAADMFVLSSHNEGMSNTTLEAMSCGLPSIVTAVSGMKSLIGDNCAGQIVPCHDISALADALVAMQRDVVMRDDMGRRAREAVVRDYALANVAARHLAQYRRLARI